MLAKINPTKPFLLSSNLRLGHPTFVDKQKDLASTMKLRSITRTPSPSARCATVKGEKLWRGSENEVREITKLSKFEIRYKRNS